MNVSQWAVHPVEAPPLQTEDVENVPLPRVRMKDLQGMPGTVSGLALRVGQLLFAVVALTVMATTGDFPSVTAFWSLCMDGYIKSGRALRMMDFEDSVFLRAKIFSTFKQFIRRSWM